jgi:hypothetical protein
MPETHWKRSKRARPEMIRPALKGPRLKLKGIAFEARKKYSNMASIRKAPKNKARKKCKGDIHEKTKSLI